MKRPIAIRGPLQLRFAPDPLRALRVVALTPRCSLDLAGVQVCDLITSCKGASVLTWPEALQGEGRTPVRLQWLRGHGSFEVVLSTRLLRRACASDGFGGARFEAVFHGQ